MCFFQPERDNVIVQTWLSATRQASNGQGSVSHGFLMIFHGGEMELERFLC